MIPRRALVLVALLMVVAPAFGAAAFRQQANCTTTGTSCIATLPSGILDDSLLFVCAARRAGGAITGVASPGNTTNWAQIHTFAGNNNRQIDAWYVADANASADPNVTITWSGSARSQAVVLEYTGIRTVGAIDADKATANTGGSPVTTNPVGSGTVASASLDQAANLLLACIARIDNGEASSLTFSGQTGSYTERTDTSFLSGSTGPAILVADKIIAAAEDAVVDANSSTAGSWVGTMSVFKVLPATETLTVTPAGAGKGRVTSSPAGMICLSNGTNCTFDYDQGQVVTLTAQPVYDSTFSGWSGHAECNDGTPGVVTMDTDKGCTATFTQKARFDLTVTMAGACTGLVRSAGREIDCDKATGCNSDSHEYITGDIEWLNTYPDPGCKFDGFTGTGAPATTVGGSVTMSAARTITATFSAQGGSAETFFVDPNGSNATNCTGLSPSVYDGSGTGEACAFNTITEGVNAIRGANPFNCTNGDDVVVSGAVTYSEAVVMPTVCQCPSRENPCVIKLAGDTTIVDPGAGVAALRFGHSTGASRARFIEIRGGRYKGGTAANVGATAGATVATETSLVDLLLTDFAQFGPKTGPPDSAIQFTESFSSADKNVIDGVRFDGDVTSCVDFQANNGAHVCGTRFANAMYLGGTQGADVRNANGKEMRGQVARLDGNTIIQDSRFEGFGCEDEAADDACFQVYDTSVPIFRNLLLINVRGNDNGSFPIIKMRRTCIGSAPCANPVNAVGMEIYNVTVASTDCVGATSGCAPNSHGSAIRADGFVSFKDGPGAGDLGVYGEMASVRNIYKGIAGSGSLVLYTDDDTDVNSVCPTPLQWSGDIFYQSNTNPANRKTCTGTIEGYDSSNVQVDPGLDVNLEPTAWAEACFPLGSSYTARDGDPARGYVGAYAGACASAPASESCFDGLKNQNETCPDGGGVCGATCANGQGCAGAGDCVSGLCTGGICAAPAPPAAVVIGRNPSATRGWPWWNSRSTRRVRP